MPKEINFHLSEMGVGKGKSISRGRPVMVLQGDGGMGSCTLVTVPLVLPIIGKGVTWISKMPPRIKHGGAYL